MLDPAHDNSAYLIGRLAALAETARWRVPAHLHGRLASAPAYAIANLNLATKGRQDEIGEIMQRLPPDLPKAVPMHHQGDYWLGYYHQRAALGLARRLSKLDLRAIGEALYGEQWQSAITRALGLTDSSRVRQWLSGRRPIPAGAATELMALLRLKSATTSALADALDNADSSGEE